MEYESCVEVRSSVAPGVVLRVRKVSFAQRTELIRKVSELAQKIECFKAGSSVAEQLEAQRLEREIASAYLEWGLVGVEGLKIDGKSATPSSLVEYGPEELVEEALKAITSQLGLREEERKN